MNITQSIQGHIEAQLEKNWNIEARVQKYAQAIDHCIKWFESNDIKAFENDESVFIECMSQSGYNFEVQISSAEVFYRADLYKSKMEES
jgi:hypothetical protein|tara:strand:+ start:494 stop:760 length:267 start_codon:yes stop_codon:yes gene_type:complete